MSARRHHRHILYLLPLLGAASILIAFLLPGGADAQGDDPTFHPIFPLLDSNGANVLDTGEPISTMQTCGSCHDAAFIAEHSGHADAGFSTLDAPGSVEGGRPWEMSDGLYGGWSPLTYRYLSPEGDSQPDLTREEWVRVNGAFHVGGGPAAPDVEMNCFLCHAAAPNNAARVAALQADDLSWANTATLAGTGIVAEDGAGGWSYQADAFNADDTVREDLILIQDPSDANCGQCHGQVHSDAQDPMQLLVGEPAQRATYTTGQVFSPQRLLNSGVNLENRDELGRSWDVHAERAVNCIDCHYALNNPVYHSESSETRPDHLTFDPRRMDFGDYLYRPLHQFANTAAAAETEFGSAVRTCSSCHDAESTHTWLPYTARHISALSCETCHVPTLYAPAVAAVDWTALHLDGTALVAYRGMEGDLADALITGYTPALLPVESEESTQLAPHNLISAWYWVYGDPPRPVRLEDLRAAYFEGETYHPDVLAAFDADGSGTLSEIELRLDSDEKTTLIQGRLAALGLENPRITGEVQPYEIHHDVTYGEWATRDCQTCHTDESRLTAPILLTDYLPGGIEPTFLGGDASMSGTLLHGDGGTLLYRPDTGSAPAELYVFGHDNVAWIDLLGLLMFLGVFAGVIAHGGLRYISARRLAARMGPVKREARRVYMYSVYERQWHWLQTVAIFGLLFTGLVIHRPAMFSMFSFEWVVPVHNALALLLVINAALSAFYHIVSGEIRQYLPRPYGFFDQMFVQLKYYLSGVFKGEPHPFEKTPDRKMNPLQQITYLAILNVLLPLQVITGALMWVAQHFPDLVQRLGGLPFLAPFHTLVAWAFASFIVLHLYLITTGHTPLASMKAMMLGWDEVEVRESSVLPESKAEEGTAS